MYYKYRNRGEFKNTYDLYHEHPLSVALQYNTDFSVIKYLVLSISMYIIIIQTLIKLFGGVQLLEKGLILHRNID